MALSYDECVAILQAFRKANRTLFNNRAVRGTRIMFEKEQPHLEVLVTAVADVRDAVAMHVGPNFRFRATVDGKEHDLEPVIDLFAEIR